MNESSVPTNEVEGVEELGDRESPSLMLQKRSSLYSKQTAETMHFPFNKAAA